MTKEEYLLSTNYGWSCRNGRKPSLTPEVRPGGAPEVRRSPIEKELTTSYANRFFDSFFYVCNSEPCVFKADSFHRIAGSCFSGVV